MGRLAALFQRLGIQRHDSATGDVDGDESIHDVEFRIPNMVCEGCTEKIDAALHAVAGVREIRANVAQKRIRIRYEPSKVRPEQLKDAVAQAGFRAEP